MSTVTVTLNRFDGGMTSDPRDTRANVCRRCEAFDVFTNPHKLTPFRNVANGDPSASTNQIGNFAYTGGILYGLGVGASPTFTADTYEMASFPDGTWSEYKPYSGSWTSSRTTADLPAFVIYHGVYYGVRGGRYVWAANPSGSAVDGVSGTTLDASNYDLTSYSTVSNFIVHSKDDCLYGAADHRIIRKNASTWETALTLPSRYTVTTITEYGNYLAIACFDGQGGDSVVYLWDRDSSVTTLSEVISWGSDTLILLTNYFGALIGISKEQDANSQDKTISIRYWNGQGPSASPLFSFKGSSYSAISKTSQRFKGRLYFMASIPFGSNVYSGVWSLSRSSEGQPLALSLECPLNNSTSYETPTLYSFIIAGDYVIQSFLDDDSNWMMTKTTHGSTAGAWASAAIYETCINPGMPAADRDKTKQLASVAIATEPLTSDQQAVLKYRVDGGAWTTIMTVTATGATVTEQPFDTNGDPFASGREYEFDAESTGGAEITGIIYRYRTLATSI